MDTALPPRTGYALNVESSIVALTHEHATEIFRDAIQRLLNIGKWHTLPCSLLNSFRLTDDKGQVVDRQVRENDYFIVEGTNGHDEWIKVEKVCSQRDPSGQSEVVTITARSSSFPMASDDDPARPSNTFQVVRHGLNISAVVYGQNDREDDKGTSTQAADDPRPDSTIGAIPGVARVQWRSLVNGLLSTW